jgi:hypothetical protein
MLQARSPTLDLDSIYGFGPTDENDRIFYAADGARLTLGRTQASGPPPIANLDLDGFDLPHKGASTAEPLEARMAQIPDPRITRVGDLRIRGSHRAVPSGGLRRDLPNRRVDDPRPPQERE